MPLFVSETLASGSRDDAIPSGPIVVMRLAEFTPENDGVYIGSHLMTDGEIDELVDRVVEDAQSFRRLAKHDLQIAQSRASKS